MRIGIPRERLTNETRVAATPKNSGTAAETGFYRRGRERARVNWQVLTIKRLCKRALKL